MHPIDLVEQIDQNHAEHHFRLLCDTSLWGYIRMRHLPRRLDPDSYDLPSNYDKYLDWKRRQGGLLAAMREHLDRSGRDATETAEKVAASFSSMRGLRGLPARLPKARSFANTLGRFLSGKSDLRPHELTALMRTIGMDPQRIHSFLVDPVELCLHRSQWETRIADDIHAERARIKKTPIGGAVLPVVTHSPRLLDAYIRTSLPGPKLEGRFYTSPGPSATYVIKGKIRAGFYRFGTHDLEAGDLIFYEGEYPHFIIAPLGDATVLDVTMNSEGLGSEFFSEYFAPSIPASEFKSVPLLAILRANVSMALNSMRSDSIKMISRAYGLSLRRVRQLKSGTGAAPRASEIESLAYLLRIPKNRFYLPFDERRQETVAKVIRKSDLLQQAHTLRSSAENIREREREDWIVNKLYDFASYAPSPRQFLTVQVLVATGPREPHRARFLRTVRLRANSHEVPTSVISGEQLLWGVRGELGVSLRIPLSRDQPSEGVLMPNDGAWFTTDLEYALFAPGNQDDSAIALRFECPYPTQSPDER